MLHILHDIFLVCFQSNGSFGFVIQKPAGTGAPRLLTVQGAPLSDSFLLFGWSLLAKPHEKKKSVALLWAWLVKLPADGLKHLTACPDVVEIEFQNKNAGHFIGLGFNYLTM